MNGSPALSEGFANLPYVNPDAPKGGRVIFGEVGGFDSLNPYILKGSAPWPIRVHVVESLMARSYDEPFTLYGLLAESIEVPDDRSWVEFALRQDARFSDGSPVTVEDVIWSFTTLGEQGHPRYRNAWVGVDTVRQTGPRTVRFDLIGGNRELPLILGLRPIL
ncbi:MAG: ABC transporter substrate-binding protein, partial [Pseudomonadota bacterium]